MAKQAGLGDNFYIGGFDLSGDVASLDQISGGPNPLAGTAVKQSAQARLFGIRNGTMKFTTLFEQTPTIVTPSVPASGTPVISTYNVTVFVTITGGTFTGSGIVINGVSQGTSPGTFAIPALGTITLNYSVAPTWNWFALGSEHNALSTLPRTDTIGTYFRGTTVGNAAACCNAKQLSYDGTRDDTGNLTFQVEMDSNSFGLEWGEMLTAGIRTDTAPTTGASRDDGAGTNFGAQAYLQLVALVGTNIDITITHSTTSGGSYATLMDFGSQAAIGSFRQSVPNNTTVNEFIKVVSAGTFTYAQFAVAFMRNPIAGVTF